MSVADLWIGFLHFYAGGFDDARLVVSIRQGFILSYFFESKIYTIDTFQDFLLLRVSKSKCSFDHWSKMALKLVVFVSLTKV